MHGEEDFGEEQKIIWKDLAGYPLGWMPSKVLRKLEVIRKLAVLKKLKVMKKLEALRAHATLAPCWLMRAVSETTY